MGKAKARLLPLEVPVVTHRCFFSPSTSAPQGATEPFSGAQGANEVVLPPQRGLDAALGPV